MTTPMEVAGAAGAATGGLGSLVMAGTQVANTWWAIRKDRTQDAERGGPVTATTLTGGKTALPGTEVETKTMTINLSTVLRLGEAQAGGSTVLYKGQHSPSEPNEFTISAIINVSRVMGSDNKPHISQFVLMPGEGTFTKPRTTGLRVIFTLTEISTTTSQGNNVPGICAGIELSTRYAATGGGSNVFYIVAWGDGSVSASNPALYAKALELTSDDPRTKVLDEVKEDRLAAIRRNLAQNPKYKLTKEEEKRHVTDQLQSGKDSGRIEGIVKKELDALDDIKLNFFQQQQDTDLQSEKRLLDAELDYVRFLLLDQRKKKADVEARLASWWNDFREIETLINGFGGGAVKLGKDERNEIRRRLLVDSVPKDVIKNQVNLELTELQGIMAWLGGAKRGGNAVTLSSDELTKIRRRLSVPARRGNASEMREARMTAKLELVTEKGIPVYYLEKDEGGGSTGQGGIFKDIVDQLLQYLNNRETTKAKEEAKKRQSFFTLKKVQPLIPALLTKNDLGDPVLEEIRKCLLGGLGADVAYRNALNLYNSKPAPQQNPAPQAPAPPVAGAGSDPRKKENQEALRRMASQPFDTKAAKKPSAATRFGRSLRFWQK